MRINLFKASLNCFSFQDKFLMLDGKWLKTFIRKWNAPVWNIKFYVGRCKPACYAMWSVKPYASLNTLKMIYYSYFPSVMTYGLLFRGHTSDSIKIFRLQKKIIRILMGCRYSDSCRKLFFNLEILPLPSLLLFVIRNMNQFLVNSEIYHVDTRQHANFQHPSVNLTECQKEVI